MKKAINFLCYDDFSKYPKRLALNRVISISVWLSGWERYMQKPGKSWGLSLCSIFCITVSDLFEIWWCKSTEDDIVDGDEQKFDDISDASHDCETNRARCGNLFEFYIEELIPATSGFSHTYKNLLLSTANFLVLSTKLWTSYIWLIINLRVFHDKLAIISLNHLIYSQYSFGI